jgi:hypothetical protein
VIQCLVIPQKLSYIFLLSFSLDEKETKNQGKKMLPRTRLGLARFFADPTHIVNGIKFLVHKLYH